MQEMVNWYATRRHYVGRELGSQTWVQFRSLCGKAAGDSLEKDAERRLRMRRPTIDYAALPMCKFCERIAARADA